MPNLTDLRTRRQSTGVKSGEFAARIGYSRSTIVSVENGTRPASHELIHRIARELTDLGVPTTSDDLLKRTPDRPPDQPKGPKAPPDRKDKEGDKKGPRRVEAVA